MRARTARAVRTALAPGELDRSRRGRRTILAGCPRIALGAQLHPGHIAEDDLRTVRIGPQHDGSEGIRRGQLALGRQRDGDPLPGHRGRIADAAWRDLHVLLIDRVGQIRQGQAVGDQLRRVDPDPHGALGAKQLNPAHAIDTAQFFDDVARHVVAERHIVQPPITGFQAHQHQEAGVRRLHGQPILAHHLGQARLNGLDPVLNVDLGQLGICAGPEGCRDRGLARGVGR